MSGVRPSVVLTIVLEGANELICTLDVQSDQLIGDVKAMLEGEWSIPKDQMSLFYQARHLQDTDRLDQVGIASNDILQARRQARAQTTAANAPSANRNQLVGQDPADVQRQIRSYPGLLSQLRSVNPALADAAMNSDPDIFATMWQEYERISVQQMEQARRVQTLNADPFSEEHQRAIEEEIHRGNVQSNMEAAIEHNPEAFAKVCMLYIDLKVNHKSVLAFVDCGAQSTIMSLKTAQKCGIHNLIDTRFAGVAKGVGTGKIVGRIHYVEVKLGSHYIACSLTILEDSPMELLWGLDMLKKHQMSIDLKQNCLCVGDDKVPFLNEQQLPGWANDNQEEAKSPSNAGPTQSVRRVPAPVSSALSTGNPASSSSSSSSNSADIQTLVDLGFPLHAARRALESCGGNVEMAAGLLFQQSPP